MIEIRAVGGYNEVGKNMTAVKVDDEVVIFDMGIHLENYIRLTEEEDLIKVLKEDMVRVGAVPNEKTIDDWKDKVKAIVPSHAHLDHIGAIPHLASKYKADIVCTPFTSEVINRILKDERIKIKNNIKSVHPNSSYKISDNLTIEFINVTHSTPQTAMLALHTKYGTILYATDFKFDIYPTLGKKPNFKRLKELENVIALIVDSTYSNDERKMPSESVARQMLKEIMFGTVTENKAIIVTTFSSHLARLKSILKFTKKMGREPIFLGRSLTKYINAGENIGIVDFSEAKVVRMRKKIHAMLGRIMKNKSKYVVIVTGHQGEPKAVLSRMANGETPWKFSSDDFVIFSCKTIPTQTNIENREELEYKLKKKGVRLFKDIHVSGHAAKEDIKDLFLMTKPKLVIPAHGNEYMKNGIKNICNEMNIDSVILADGEYKIL